MKQRQVKLFIYNYEISQLADFKTNFADAVHCMKLMNNNLALNYNGLPENIFYFIQYKTGKSKNVVTYVDAFGLSIERADKMIEKVKSASIVAGVDFLI